MSVDTTAFPFALRRNAHGRLELSAADGGQAQEVVPVRAFPIGAEAECIALVGQGGRELAWIPRLADVPREARELIGQELARRDFMPEIRAIVAVSSYATPSTWTVRTDRGDTRLLLKSEQDIRRVSGSKLLVSDGNGIHFLIPDTAALDRASRRFLDRFL